MERFQGVEIKSSNEGDKGYEEVLGRRLENGEVLKTS